jgi:hypothetical protein
MLIFRSVANATAQIRALGMILSVARELRLPAAVTLCPARCR